jgi:hypothetical protein
MAGIVIRSGIDDTDNGPLQIGFVVSGRSQKRPAHVFAELPVAVACQVAVDSDIFVFLLHVITPLSAA